MGWDEAISVQWLSGKDTSDWVMKTCIIISSQMKTDAIERVQFYAQKWKKDREENNCNSCLMACDKSVRKCESSTEQIPTKIWMKVKHM